MKQYSNSPRKPMMYGGESRMKRMSGSPQQGEKKPREQMNPKGATTMQDMTGATDAEMQAQEREMLRRNNSDDQLRKIAEGQGKRALMAREILKNEGKLERRTGPQEPAGKMYGGKAKK